jgi:GNAT superfamily N-acetyltransferase
VITADPADAPALSQVIADAFHDLPQSHWLIPDPVSRREIFPGYFRLFVEHALASGFVYTTANRSAVALWLPGGDESTAPPADYEERLAAATGPWLERFLAFDATLDQNHPGGIPHHQLAMLAVLPDKQGRGTGTSLLRAHHQLLDQDLRVPAYLEAAEPRSRELYLRHGYADRADGPFRFPDGGPPMWPMWREPQPPC